MLMKNIMRAICYQLAIGEICCIEDQQEGCVVLMVDIIRVVRQNCNQYLETRHNTSDK